MRSSAKRSGEEQGDDHLQALFAMERLSVRSVRAQAGSGIANNVPEYAMFASGIIARSAYHWQIWAKAHRRGVVAAYTLLADVTTIFIWRQPKSGTNF